MSDLNVNTFKARRAEIVKRMDKNSVLLISSAKLVSRNNDTTFPFRQDSNFYYCTGFQEPNSVMLLHSNGHSTLFCRQKNPELEKWDGVIRAGFFWTESVSQVHAEMLDQGFAPTVNMSGLHKKTGLRLRLSQTESCIVR